MVSNLRIADETALFAESQEKPERLIGNATDIGKARQGRLNVKKTKLLKIVKIHSYARVDVDDDTIEEVEHLKYIGYLKPADGNCRTSIRSRIRMAMNIMLDFVPIWRDRGINKDLKMKLVRSLVWTVLSYGTDGCTLTKAF